MVFPRMSHKVHETTRSHRLPTLGSRCETPGPEGNQSVVRFARHQDLVDWSSEEGLVQVGRSLASPPLDKRFGAKVDEEAANQ